MRLDPNLAFKLPFAADPMNVQQYVQMCGLQGKVEAEDLPFAYVASSFLYPTVCLLSQRRYLFPVLGGIHVHNYFRWEPLKMQQKYEGLLKVQETVKFTRKGAEVTFPQVLLNEQGREVWRSTTTVLVPCRNPPQDPSTSIGAEAVPTKRMGLVDECRSQGLKVVLVRERAFKTAADTGRRFAAVVKDYNPIHLFTWSARLFGFRRAICHGMYVGALALEEALDAWRAEGGGDDRHGGGRQVHPALLCGKWLRREDLEGGRQGRRGGEEAGGDGRAARKGGHRAHAGHRPSGPGRETVRGAGARVRQIVTRQRKYHQPRTSPVRLAATR